MKKKLFYTGLSLRFVAASRIKMFEAGSLKGDMGNLGYISKTS
jgi:hypothetical protein